jgi:hypothetical protein
MDPRAARFAPLAMFFLLLVAYHGTGDFLPTNDAFANLHVGLALARHRTFEVTPGNCPHLFAFELATPLGPQPLSIRRWEEPIRGRPASELYAQGEIRLSTLPYYLVPATKPGVFASIYGPGAGISAAPVFGILELFGADLTENVSLLWQAGKFVAAMLVAGSAVLLYWTCLSFGPPRRALLVCASYGLGTCVWSMSSQSLWQQAPTVFLLALGLFCATRSDRGRIWSGCAGAAFAAAVVCRPTAMFVGAAFGIGVGLRDRRTLGCFILGTLPFAIFLAVYNASMFGSPFRFGQTETAAATALSKTGSSAVWQTPLWVGLPGLLISPARGLLVFSPFLGFALWGVWRVWKDDAWRSLRPASAAFVLLMILSSLWFDWWGGHSFGYRLLADLMPLLALLLLPALERIERQRPLQLAYYGLLAFSVGVQVIGAFAYNNDSWDDRLAYQVHIPGREEPVRVLEEAEGVALIRANPGSRGELVYLDIDVAEHRHRLWSISDSPLPYFASHFGEARRKKLERIGLTTGKSPP